MLAQPLTLPSGLVLQNRLAKAALTEGLADDDQRPGPALLRYSRAIAHGGAGLAITGNVMIDRRYLERAGNVAIEDARHLDALSAWAEAAGDRGTPVLVQINHPGRQTNRMMSSQPVAPSAVAAVSTLRAFAPPRALEVDEIEEIIQRFGRTAQVVQRAGFAGVQVHAAHGYLLSQFLSPRTNLRTDPWGGSLENRARALREAVRAARAATTAPFTVAVKLNSADFQRGGFEEDEALQVVRWLADDGIDLIEISGGNYESPALLGKHGPSTSGSHAQQRASTVAREAYFLDFARKVRAVSRVPLMVTGGFRSRLAMQSALDEDALDLVGLGRPLLLEPDLPRRLLTGQAERAVAGPAPLGAGALSQLAETCYYDAQIGRLGRGLAPKPGLSPYGSIRHYLAREFTSAVRRFYRGSLRRALPASCATPTS